MQKTSLIPFLPMSSSKSKPKSMVNATPRRTVGHEVLEGLRQLKRGKVGRVVSVPSVTAIREATGLSQAKFALLLGVSVRTLQEWEQGRRAPSGAARTLLLIAMKNPRALLEVA
jgi:putative transcriptional regulator